MPTTVESLAPLHADMTAWRRDIHAHPELGFEESRTAGRVAALLEGVQLYPQTLINVRLPEGSDWKRNGALDASRGAVRGPDAIIDTRSLPPGVPVRYVYQLDAAGHPGPLTIAKQ